MSPNPTCLSPAGNHLHPPCSQGSPIDFAPPPHRLPFRGLLESFHNPTFPFPFPFVRDNLKDFFFQATEIGLDHGKFRVLIGFIIIFIQNKILDVFLESCRSNSTGAHRCVQAKRPISGRARDSAQRTP